MIKEQEERFLEHEYVFMLNAGRKLQRGTVLEK
jgi:hypothetical protein